MATIAYGCRYITVAKEMQAEKLALCGIDTSRFGNDVDPGLLALLAPAEPARMAVDLAGFVATSQTLRLEEPIKLDQELALTGRLDQHQDASGCSMLSTINLANGNGHRLFSAEAALFRRNPKAPRGPGRTASSSSPTGRILAQARFTPEAVAQYSDRQGNPIHFDQPAAERAGFRAPIAGGTHALHYLTAAAWLQLSERPIALEVAFLRPIFWDDCCDVVADLQGDGSFDLVRDGKSLVSIRIKRASN